MVFETWKTCGGIIIWVFVDYFRFAQYSRFPETFWARIRVEDALVKQRLPWYRLWTRTLAMALSIRWKAISKHRPRCSSICCPIGSRAEVRSIPPLKYRSWRPNNQRVLLSKTRSCQGLGLVCAFQIEVPNLEIVPNAAYRRSLLGLLSSLHIATSPRAPNSSKLRLRFCSRH